jgi:hypothetical protein
MVGSCHKPTSIKIIDESDRSGAVGRSMINSQNSHFKSYVNTISKYAFAKIDEMGQCQGNWQGDPQVELVFVYRPAISYGIAPFNFDLTKSNNTRQLDSPWVKLAISSSPKLFVRGMFVWNERQFLLDQAVLSDERAAITKPPVPIHRDIFSQFVQDYEDAVFLAPSLEAEATAKANLSKRLPSDILWLCHHAWQSTLAPFIGSVVEALDKTIEQRAVQYTSIAKTLLIRRFTSLQIEQRYESILDLKDVLKIDTYRINRIRRY